MSTNKRMIFHLPDFIDFNNPISGSQVRPLKLINAFKEIGYNVDVVCGYGNERKQKIKKVKQKIKNGVIYDFVYSESSTTPTLLTEKCHLPIFPFLDFSFLFFCKRNKLKIALFYRDIYWNFDFFKKNIYFIKYLYLRFFYLLDLRIYNRIVDVLFLPSLRMKDFIPYKFDITIDELPPGVDKIEDKHLIKNKNLNKLQLIYVGDISELYRIDLLMKSISCDYKLNVCCRKVDWDKNFDYYRTFLNSNIRILHYSGEMLKEIYLTNDIACLFIEPSLYRSFSVPVKFFEYLSFELPVIGVKGNTIADFIDKYNVGWTINYSENELNDLLLYLKCNPDAIKEKVDNIKRIMHKITWHQRALRVKNLLLN
ncbi:glycosyltransferase family protein [Acetobacteroides hydrogenigenes]|uniref:Glycosyltransferase involved in cell wall biosynthesis n=1 Tax=Acetobacteroides hydrogenigenes TaxID=979970 RepID=A0A4R2E6W7_9BACT|nr:glycosyltransferase family 1 protein [Acetobacteroides hydrogenigenes]TCN62202.1 glycosyltransferase involved in cell wall biosynthesis [Acetobacteroides hydrogenigenes]